MVGGKNKKQIKSRPIDDFFFECQNANNKRGNWYGSLIRASCLVTDNNFCGISESYK